MQGQDKMADDVSPSVKQYKFSYRLSIYNILVNINRREIVRACVIFHNLSTKSTIDLLCERCCNCMCLVCLIRKENLLLENNNLI